MVKGIRCQSSQIGRVEPVPWIVRASGKSVIAVGTPNSEIDGGNIGSVG